MASAGLSHAGNPPPNPLPEGGETERGHPADAGPSGSCPSARATPYATPAARRQRPRCGARSSSNACPPTVVCAAVGERTNRSPITSTASVASVRPTPANTIPKLRWRARSVSSSSIRPAAVPCASSIDVSAGSVTVTVNVSTGSTRRSSSVRTTSVPAVAPAATVTCPAATAS